MTTLPQTQKAIRIHETGGLDVTRYEDVPVPELGEGQVLVKNNYSGLNFIESYFRTGLYPAQMPMTHGREGTGEIVKSNSSKYQVGEKVAYLSSGCMQEYVALSDTGSKITKLPSGIDELQASAGFLQGMTAWTLVSQAYKVSSKDTVLVHAAAGGTGALIVQFAKSLGATVIGTTSTPEKVEIAKQAGCDFIINYRQENTVERVQEITSGKGCSVIYDSVGKDTWDVSKECASVRGTIASFGNASGAVPPFKMLELSPKSLTVTRPVLFNYIITSEEFAEVSGKVVNAIADGSLKVRVSETFALQDFAKGMEKLESGKTVGKLMVKL